MIENIVVLVIVAVAVFFLVRRICYTLGSKDISCGCEGCSGGSSCELKNIVCNSGLEKE